MLKLKLQYFGHLMRRTDSLEKTLMLGNIEGAGEGDDRGWHGWMVSPIRWVWASSRTWWWTGRPGVLQSMGLQSRTWLSDWTELNTKNISWKLISLKRKETSPRLHFLNHHCDPSLGKFPSLTLQDNDLWEWNGVFRSSAKGFLEVMLKMSDHPIPHEGH